MEKPPIIENNEPSLEEEEGLLEEEIQKFEPSFQEVMDEMGEMDFADAGKYTEAMHILDRGFQDARAKIAALTGIGMGSLMLLFAKTPHSELGERAAYGVGAMAGLMILGLGLSKAEEWINEFKASRQRTKQWESKND